MFLHMVIRKRGTITTPFDMRVQNEIDRLILLKMQVCTFHSLEIKGSLPYPADERFKLVEHKQYIAEYGQDLPEIRDWKWHK